MAEDNDAMLATLADNLASADDRDAQHKAATELMEAIESNDGFTWSYDGGREELVFTAETAGVSVKWRTGASFDRDGRRTFDPENGHLLVQGSVFYAGGDHGFPAVDSVRDAEIQLNK